MSTFVHINDTPVSIEVFNRDFIILRNPESDGLVFRRLGLALYKYGFDFVEELIQTETEILIKLNAQFRYSDLQKLTEVRLDEQLFKARKLKWPVWFEGPDWSHVSEYSGLTKNAYIDKICSTIYSVRMLGFLPGFVYTGNLADALVVPRKATPVQKVDPGTIAVAENYIGLYSLPSPGGWNCIGRMPCSILNYPQLPPVLIRPSDNIEFVPIGQVEYDTIIKKQTDILTYNGIH